MAATDRITEQELQQYELVRSIPPGSPRELSATPHDDDGDILARDPPRGQREACSSVAAGIPAIQDVKGARTPQNWTRDAESPESLTQNVRLRLEIPSRQLGLPTSPLGMHPWEDEPSRNRGREEVFPAYSPSHEQRPGPANTSAPSRAP
ncbi:hypothetical protein BU16DRAFT_568271 [Lophium mytilinum]|uniref:Uncharacterized protein n=1 Tax=Lophium mytilinum TaxID=390894 RepID=A0A6A6Q8I7_9PEZI|nr:hypothetical protein BU16DRAFT_568271 [Lophium mytilinum]